MERRSIRNGEAGGYGRVSCGMGWGREERKVRDSAQGLRRAGSCKMTTLEDLGGQPGEVEARADSDGAKR